MGLGYDPEIIIINCVREGYKPFSIINPPLDFSEIYLEPE